MRRRVKSRIPVFCLVLIMVSSMTGCVIVSALSDQVNQSVQTNEPYWVGNGFVNGDGEGHMNSLISLLKDMGVDISYGEDGGTIFSMVDQSLTRIITDLSSGNTEGFTGIPLIWETLTYLGISPDDIIVQPEDVPSSMAAIDRYNQRYSGKPNTTP